MEAALDGDDVSCGIDDEVIASTPLEILDDPFDAMEDDDESSILAVSGSTRPCPSFWIGDLDSDRSFEILFSAKHDGLGLFDFLLFDFPRADLFDWLPVSAISALLENWNGDEDELGDGGDDPDVCSTVLTSPSTRQEDGESRSTPWAFRRWARMDVISGQA